MIQVEWAVPRLTDKAYNATYYQRRMAEDPEWREQRRAAAKEYRVQQALKESQ